MEGKTNESLWTDDEVQLYLRVTLDYKTKYQENVDGETLFFRSRDSDDVIIFTRTRRFYCPDGNDVTRRKRRRHIDERS